MYLYGDRSKGPCKEFLIAKAVHVMLETLAKVFSPPARWGLLDFMSVASSSSSSSSSSSFSSLFSSSSSSSCSTAIHVSVPCRTSTTTIHVCPAGPQPRPSTPSVPCRTSTTTIHAQCSLPDLNHDHPRPVFPADLNHDHPRPVFPAGPQPGWSWLRSGREHVGRYGTKNVQKKVRKNVRKNVRRYARRYAR